METNIVEKDGEKPFPVGNPYPYKESGSVFELEESHDLPKANRISDGVRVDNETESNTELDQMNDN
jgi:hypothetical protein